MKRRTSLTLALGIPLAAPSLAGAQQPATIRVIGQPTDGFKNIMYGVRSGIFRRAGVDVAASVVPSGAAASAALIGGAADVVYTNVGSPVVAYRKGVPIRFLLPANLTRAEHPTVSMLVLKDGPIRSGKDLNGKTIGTPGLGDLAAIATLSWIDQNGGDAKSVHQVEVGVSSAAPLLEQGRVDAVTLNEPYGAQAMESGKVRLLGRPMAAIAGEFEGAGYAVMEPTVLKNPDAMMRFAGAFHEASAYTNTHPVEMVDLVASITGITPDVVAKMQRVIDPEYLEPRNIQPVIDAFAKYGMIDRAFPAQEIISSAALKAPR